MEKCLYCDKDLIFKYKRTNRKWCDYRCLANNRNKNKRDKNICIDCGIKIEKINTNTGKLYARCDKCLLNRRIYINKQYIKNKEKIKIRSKIYFRESSVRIKERERLKRQIAREEFFNIYGNECFNCGEKFKGFLSLEHINGDGKDHRKKRNGCNRLVYKDATKEYRPDLFQVLCYNCNFYKGINLILPNKKEIKQSNTVEYSIEDYSI